jgi:soluble lytic murein transglycosylase-like protein
MAINMNNAAYLRDKVQAAKNKYANPVQQPVKPTVQPVKTASPVQKVQQQPTFTTQSSNTNYGGQGNPYNEIAYLKNLYETSTGKKGTQNWAANEAKKYYGMLDPNEANKIGGFNSVQLKDYIGQMNSKPTTPATPVQPQQPDFLKQYMDQIGGAYDKQQQAALERFKAQRDQAIGQINQQKAELAPQYAGLRNQADVVNAQNVAKLRELMASQGLSGSGENVTSSVALGSARQGALNQLNTQEQQQRNDFDRRIADLNNPSELNAIQAALDADRMRAMADAMRYGDERSYQRERDSVMDGRYDQEWSYQKERDSVADGRYDAEWAYQQQRDKVGDEQWNKQFKSQEEARKAEQAWREYTFKNMSASEKKNFEIMQKQFGEEQAWKYYQMNYQGELEKSLAQSEIDFYKNSGFNSGGGGGDALKNAPGNVQGYINNASSQYGVPANLVAAIIKTESGFNANAKSPAGAYGLMQLMPATARGLGVNPSDPQSNVNGGTRYIKQMMDMFGDIKLALAAYNAGPGNVQKAIGRAGTKDFAQVVKFLPKETQNYVPKVLSYYS